MKGLPWFVFVALFLIRESLGAIQVSEPIAISPPGLTTNVMRRRSYPTVTRGQKSILLSWVEFRVAPGSATNAMTVAIDSNGELAQPAGVMVGPEFFGSTPLELYPAGEDFFAIYSQRLNASQDGSDFLFTVVDANGSAMIPPKIFATNAPYYARVSASNGKTLLNIAGSGPTTSSLNYKATLSAKDGHLIAQTNLFTTNSAPTSNPVGRLASAGGNYLFLYSTTRVQGLLFNGETGIFSSRVISTNRLELLGLASNENEYLLAARLIGTASQVESGYVTLFYRLDAEGNILSTGSMTNDLPASWRLKIFANGSDWLVFDGGNFVGRDIRSYAVKAEADRLVVERDPYPALQGYDVASFAAGKLILTVVAGQNVGYQIVTAEGTSAVKSPLAWAAQGQASVAASPFGYLAVWQEMGDRTNLLGMRLTKSGARGDSAPFLISEHFVNSGEAPLAWDGTNYLAVWDNGSALVSAEGAPNVREFASGNALVSQFTSGYLQMVPWGNRAVLFHRQLSSPGDTVASSFEVGSAVPALTKYFEKGTFASRGEELLHAGPHLGKVVAGGITNLSSFKVWSAEVGFGDISTAIGYDSGYYIVWNDNGRLASGELQDRVVTRTNLLDAAVPLDTPVVVGVSSNRFLLSVMLTNSGAFSTNKLIAVNRSDFSVSEIDEPVMLRSDALVSIASAGRDFLMAETLWNGATTYAALKWVTDVAQPVIGSVTVSAGQLLATVQGLNSSRSYRVERSEDLANWQFFGSITQASEYNFVAETKGSAAFFRVVLVPE